MAAFNELLEQSAHERAQALDDIKAWREANEAWVRDQQARSDKLRSIITPKEKPSAYGSFRSTFVERRPA